MPLEPEVEGAAPPEVVDELLTFAALVATCTVDLRAPFDPIPVATDASLSGLGVCSAEWDEAAVRAVGT